MLAAARGRALAADPALAGRVSLVRGEAERLPFADAEFDALTFTYLLRYVDDRAATMRELARVVKPGGRIGMVEFGVPRRARCARCGASTPASGCRCSAGSSLRRGSRSGASWGRTSRSSTAASPTSPALWEPRWHPATFASVAMSFGAGIVMSGSGMATAPRELDRPAFLRAAGGRLARPGHAAAPSLHGLASELRRARRGRSAEALRRSAASRRSPPSSCRSGSAPTRSTSSTDARSRQRCARRR